MIFHEQLIVTFLQLFDLFGHFLSMLIIDWNKYGSFWFGPKVINFFAYFMNFHNLFLNLFNGLKFLYII